MKKNGIYWEGFEEDYKHRLQQAPWSKYFKGNTFSHYKDKTMMYLTLKEKILDYAGEDVCIHPAVYSLSDELDLKILIEGKPFKNPVLALEPLMETSQCFYNAAEAVFSIPSVKRICLGFYMDESGLWRKHAWCLDENQNLIETTKLGSAYYGVVIDEQDVLKYYSRYID